MAELEKYDVQGNLCGESIIQKHDKLYLNCKKQNYLTKN